MKVPDPVESGSNSAGSRIIPVLIVIGVATVAFVGALVIFRGGGETRVATPPLANPSSVAVTAPSPAGPSDGCSGAKPDAGYTVTMSSDPNPPRAEGTVFHLDVRHDGKAVTGAKVCITADMSDMHHAGLVNMAKETSGGAYDATLKFGMRGPYAASVVIVEPGQAAVAVALSFEVN